MIATTVALVLVTASMPLALAAWFRTRELRVGAGVMLDLWLAAGLLGLCENATWTRITGAAALIVVRKLVIYSLESSPFRSRRRTS